jgi:hypothetical protein
MKALVKLATLAFLTAALTGCWAKVSEELGEDPSTKIETDEQRKVPDIVNGETQEVESTSGGTPTGNHYKITGTLYDIAETQEVTGSMSNQYKIEAIIE